MTGRPDLQGDATALTRPGGATRLAFFILCHKAPHQVIRLIERLRDDLGLRARMPIHFERGLQFPAEVLVRHVDGHLPLTIRNL